MSHVLNYPLKPTCVGTRVAGQSAQANICATTHHPLRAVPPGTACSARTYATGTQYRVHVSENTCLRKAGILCIRPYLLAEPHLAKPPPAETNV